MPIRPPEYDHVVEALTPVLHELPGKIVAIDGRDGVGKTSLGRYLAWYFNVTLIETDLFLQEGKKLTYRCEEVCRIITARLEKPRPVIVEGVAVMRLLSKMAHKLDFLIYVRNLEFNGSEVLAQQLIQYEREFAPETYANLILELSGV